MTVPDRTDARSAQAEAAFHVRELGADVRAMRSAVDSGTADAALLGDLWARLEHDTSHHGDRLRTLLHQPAGPATAAPVPLREPASVEAVVDDLRDTLRRADDLLTGAVEGRDPTGALPAVALLDTALRLVRRAAEEVDPEGGPDDLWPAPARELTRPDARTLTSCPYCGAVLGPGDRTFTGSFCETCRTRWSER